MKKIINADTLIEALNTQPNYQITLPKEYADVLKQVISKHHKEVIKVINSQSVAFDEDRVHKKMWMESEEVCGDSMIDVERAMEIISEELSGGCM